MSANDMTDHDVVEDERVESVTVDEDVIDDDVTDEAVTDDDATDEGDRDEGDIAADFIEELLDIADIDGDLDIDVTGGRTYISVTADGESNLDRLASPEVVDALQQLTRLAVQAETGVFSRLILDVGGSRDARRNELQSLVSRAIERIEDGAASAALPPMSSYERKIVHDIASERGYNSESEGEGRKRHTVLRAN
ncbi:protein jag [Gulosibacter sediminis]|uniref:Jag family protein n=1 Tax=Gulosibacter sediminis TaxID=1729695 RepID=UPI0024AE1F66|nr:R3H domain-containing nucleic acid-binding protein [Gulosibacter sediminis]